MFCRNCGRRLPDFVKFCRYCGASQASPAAQQPPTQRPPVQQPPVQPSSKPIASWNCVYKVAPESEHGKYEFGGMPGGTLELYPDRLVIFKKSKLVGAAFGVIGSMIEGKGKEDMVILQSAIRPGNITLQKNVARFYLNDGRLAFIQASGAKDEFCRLMKQFLRI